MHFKNRPLLIFACVAFASMQLHCKKEKITDDTYFGSKVMILGHRGMGAYYNMPGDTYESIVPAIGIGSDGCEIDIHLTKDTQLVLYHAPELNPHTTCNGRINDQTLDQVKTCKYYGLNREVFVCSAEEVFSKLPGLTDIYFSFDCKVDEQVANYYLYQAQFIRAIKRLCDKYQMSDHVFMEGFEPFLLTAKKMGLTNKMFLAGALTPEHIELAYTDSFCGISSQMDYITEETAAAAHARGLYIMGYTPYNYALNLTAVRKKADIIQTDDPISILKLFKRYNYEYVIP